VHSVSQICSCYPRAYLAWSLDGAIEFWNAGAEQLYGFSPNEARQLGNFPQAFSHLALIGTALEHMPVGPVGNAHELIP